MSELTVDQRRADGSLRHLLTLDGLSRTELDRLLNKAQGFVRPVGVPPPVSACRKDCAIRLRCAEPAGPS